ncbi:MAG TPA: diaminopimelate epimerase [Frankiaceae bacterium]|jgi:diaminopimelate epimerase|nr:diaminopimelate epimerase [Frankiaceae bacterium]
MSVEALPELAALASASGTGSRALAFAKGEGTGNDFVLLPDREDRLRLTPELVRRLCDRRFGIGADGCLRVVPGEPGTWFMDYVNADGSIAEMCGNGARVYARYLVSAGWAQPGTLLLATRGGIRRVDVPADASADIAVDMGPPLIDRTPSAATIAGASYEGRSVSMGNPHLVCPVADPAALDMLSPPGFDAARFPHGVNIEVYARTSQALVMRVHERGSGETLSCGTGACAVAVADAASRGEESTDVLVDVPGGRLRVVWEGASVILHGPANIVAAGRWYG